MWNLILTRVFFFFLLFLFQLILSFASLFAFSLTLFFAQLFASRLILPFARISWSFINITRSLKKKKIQSWLSEALECCLLKPACYLWLQQLKVRISRHLCDFSRWWSVPAEAPIGCHGQTDQFRGSQQGGTGQWGEGAAEACDGVHRPAAWPGWPAAGHEASIEEGCLSSLCHAGRYWRQPLPVGLTLKAIAVLCYRSFIMYIKSHHKVPSPYWWNIIKTLQKYFFFKVLSKSCWVKSSATLTMGPKLAADWLVRFDAFTKAGHWLAGQFISRD